MEKIWWHEQKKENSTWHLMMSITSISISKFIRETEKGQKNSITRERESEWGVGEKWRVMRKTFLWPHKVAIIASVALQQLWNEGHTIPKKRKRRTRDWGHLKRQWRMSDDTLISCDGYIFIFWHQPWTFG